MERNVSYVPCTEKGNIFSKPLERKNTDVLLHNKAKSSLSAIYINEFIISWKGLAIPSNSLPDQTVFCPCNAVSTRSICFFMSTGSNDITFYSYSTYMGSTRKCF